MSLDPLVFQDVAREHPARVAARLARKKFPGDPDRQTVEYRRLLDVAGERRPDAPLRGAEKTVTYGDRI